MPIPIRNESGFRLWLAAAAVAAMLCCVPACSTPTAGEVSAEQSARRACDDTAADPWIGAFRDRLLVHSNLARYAVDRFDRPTTCHGRVSSVFDGQKFGALELAFAGGATLDIETFPPESIVESLSVPSGFEDEERARRLLREYVLAIGVEIDWSRPIETVESGARLVRFESAEPGFNASAELVSTAGRLTTLRFSMAL